MLLDPNKCLDYSLRGRGGYTAVVSLRQCRTVIRRYRQERRMSVNSGYRYQQL